MDSFIVKTGEDANAISLGYFSSADSAEGLRVKMRNAGYPAFVRETSRPVTEYWLYLPEAPPARRRWRIFWPVIRTWAGTGPPAGGKMVARVESAGNDCTPVGFL